MYEIGRTKRSQASCRERRRVGKFFRQPFVGVVEQSFRRRVYVAVTLPLPITNAHAIQRYLGHAVPWLRSLSIGARSSAAGTRYAETRFADDSTARSLRSGRAVTNYHQDLSRICLPEPGALGKLGAATGHATITASYRARSMARGSVDLAMDSAVRYFSRHYGKCSLQPEDRESAWSRHSA